MRLQARIRIDIEAADSVDATTHQQRVAQLYELVRGAYDQAQLDFHRRQRRTLRRHIPVGPVKHYTGCMSEYDE